MADKVVKVPDSSYWPSWLKLASNVEAQKIARYLNLPTTEYGVIIKEYPMILPHAAGLALLRKEMGKETPTTMEFVEEWEVETEALDPTKSE